MKIPLFVLGGLALTLSATTSFATTYAGNGATGFGNPVGGGSLTFTSDGTTLFGSITPGLPNGFNDTLVIYIDDIKNAGFNDISTFTDTGNGGDTLRKAISGFDGSPNNDSAMLTFAAGFGADYALAISPAQASFGALYTLTDPTNFTYGSNGMNGNANLTPTGTNGLIKDPNTMAVTGTQTFTFSIPLSLIGSPKSFTFQTTYLDGNGAYRSNETFGNTIFDNTTNTTPTGSTNVARDAATLVGIQTFVVPEPGTWVGLATGTALLIGFRRRRVA